MTTENDKGWEDKIRNHDDETGIYWIDGAEYNVDEDRLIIFMRQEILKAVEGERKEICICAAVIAEDGLIYRGNRHGDCMLSIRERGKNMKRTSDSQGFITSTGRYVTREEGRKLQDAAGMPSVDRNGYRKGTLFSEDLY